jgi:hypothetical protein
MASHLDALHSHCCENHKFHILCHYLRPIKHFGKHLLHADFCPYACCSCDIQCSDDDDDDGGGGGDNSGDDDDDDDDDGVFIWLSFFSQLQIYIMHIEWKDVHEWLVGKDVEGGTYGLIQY